jgi:hypothetical protein
MPLQYQTIVDISLELDPKNFAMRTPAGFKRDMQFEMEVLKEHDAPGGAGQIVRGVHMRLHAGSHVDAPEHNVRGGTQIHQLPLELSSATPSSRTCATSCPARRSPPRTCATQSTTASARATACCCGPITTIPTTAAPRSG